MTLELKKQDMVQLADSQFEVDSGSATRASPLRGDNTLDLSIKKSHSLMASSHLVSATRGNPPSFDHYSSLKRRTEI